MTLNDLERFSMTLTMCRSRVPSLKCLSLSVGKSFRKIVWQSEWVSDKVNYWETSLLNSAKTLNLNISQIGGPHFISFFFDIKYTGRTFHYQFILSNMSFVLLALDENTSKWALLFVKSSFGIIIVKVLQNICILMSYRIVIY